MVDTVIIKFGGGLITDKSNLCTPNLDVISRLTKSVSQLFDENYHVIIVHGAGSYGHLKSKNWHLNSGFVNDFVPDYDDGICNQEEAVNSVRNDMLQLNNLIMESLQKHGVKSISFPPHEWAIGSGENFEGDLSQFDNPEIVTVTYGDVVDTNNMQRFTILSGDDICYRLAIELKAQHMIFAMGGAPGLMTAPPNHPDSNLIPIWTPDTEYIGTHTSSIDVTGGIKLKLDRASKISKVTSNVWIIDGEHEYRLIEAIKTLKTTGTKIKS